MEVVQTPNDLYPCVGLHSSAVSGLKVPFVIPAGIHVLTVLCLRTGIVAHRGGVSVTVGVVAPDEASEVKVGVVRHRYSWVLWDWREER